MAKTARRWQVMRGAKLDIFLKVITELNNSTGRIMVSQAKREIMKVAELNMKAARV